MHFRFEHLVLVPRERMFAFFQNPARLELLHAGWSHLRVLHHEPRVRVGAETWVEVTVGWVVPLVLGFRHLCFAPPVSFSEAAIHGPFERFIHLHEFDDRDGKTIVRDLLEISLPWRYGGDLALRRIVAPAIHHMLHHRAAALSRLVGDGTVARCISGVGPASER